CELQVVGQVTCKEELMRGWEAGDRPSRRLSDQRAMAHGDGQVCGVGLEDGVLELSLGIKPRQTLPARLGGGESGVVEERASILVGSYNGLNMHQPSTCINCERECACERAGSQSVDQH